MFDAPACAAFPGSFVDNDAHAIRRHLTDLTPREPVHPPAGLTYWPVDALYYA
jgi:hypothetical protein